MAAVGAVPGLPLGGWRVTAAPSGAGERRHCLRSVGLLDPRGPSAGDTTPGWVRVVCRLQQKPNSLGPAPVLSSTGDAAPGGAGDTQPG